VELNAVLADPSVRILWNELFRSGGRQAGPPILGSSRQPQRRLTGDQVDVLVAGYLHGDSAGQLAAKVGVGKVTVLRHLEQRNVLHRAYRKVHGDLLDRALGLYQAGRSLRSVATEIGVTRGAVGDALVLAGVAIRRR
jgi:hypothetical protein